MKNKLKKPALTAGSVLIWVAVWHIAASLANQNLLIKIPLPIDTLRAFISSLPLKSFWMSVLASLSNVMLGFVSAVVIGTICGILASYSGAFKTLSAPVLHIIRSVPVAAFIVLAYLWIPNKLIPPFISFLMVFPIIKSHVDTGLTAVDKKNVEMASVFGMNRWEILRHIKIPTVMPFLREASITGLGIAWKSGIAAEVICSTSGSLGAILAGANSHFEQESTFAITLTVVILSLILENILKICWKERKF